MIWGKDDMRVISIDKEIYDDNGIRICNHYTSPDALINIINKGTLRFTHCEFLNDAEEYNYIFELLEDEKLKKHELYSFIKKIVEETGRGNSGLFYLEPVKNSRFYRIKKGDYYVFSASKDDDSLPMWCYYTKNRNYYGYAIKLDINRISVGLNEEDGKFLYGRVVYDREKQINILINKAVELDKRYKKQIEETREEEPYLDEMQSDFFDFIQMIRIFIKRPEFKHEKEVRIALLTQPSKKIQMGFNHVNGMVRPYVEYTFADKIPIKGIRMSPSIDYESAKKGLVYLLGEKGYFGGKNNNDLSSDDVDKFVKQSNIKLRY